MSRDAFGHTRNAMHHAAQVVSALAATHRPGDDPHVAANLGWDPGLGALLGRPVDGLQAGLRMRDAVWIALNDGAVVAERPVAGSTLKRALAWLQGVAVETGVEDRELVPLAYALPEHPVMHGHPFAELDEATLRRLRRWYALVHNVLTGLRAQEPRARPVRCWPHHFDLATLIVLDPESGPEDGRTIGIGMTPGDGRIARPYLYVTPWPYPQDRAQSPLSRGQWHVDDWFGAFMAPDDPSESELSAFVGEAVARCHTLLSPER